MPQIKASQDCLHKNRVSASLAESWLMDTVHELIESKGLLEKCFEHAWENYHSQSKPQQEDLALKIKNPRGEQRGISMSECNFSVKDKCAVHENCASRLEHCVLPVTQQAAGYLPITE